MCAPVEIEQQGSRAGCLALGRRESEDREGWGRRDARAHYDDRFSLGEKSVRSADLPGRIQP